MEDWVGLLIETGEIAFCVDCGGASHACGGDGLAVDMIGAIAGSEHPGDIHGGADGGSEITGIVHVEDALEQLGIGDVADGDEQAGAGEQGFGVGLEVAEADTGDLAGGDIEDFGDDGIPDGFDLGIGEGTFGHDAGGAEGIAPMDEVDLGGEAGEVGCFFAGGIAATNHDDGLVAEHGEGAVAGGAVGDAELFEFVFTGDIEVTMAGTAGDDEGLGVDLFAIDHEADGGFAEVNGIDGGEPDLSAEFLGLFLHAGHQFVAIDALWETGEVFDDAGGGQQAPGHGAGEDEGGEIGSGGVDGGGQAGTSRTNDDNFFHKAVASYCWCGMPARRVTGDEGLGMVAYQPNWGSAMESGGVKPWGFHLIEGEGVVLGMVG